MKVFISHSSDDKRFVRTLKDDLNENGVNTWFDEDELNFGDSLLEKLELSLEDTSHFIIVLSESSINSPWVQFELTKVLDTINSQSLKKKIIPIKYKECLIPEQLSHLLFADVCNITRVIVGDKLVFNDENYIKFINKLIKSLKSQSSKLTKADKEILANPAIIENITDNEKKYLKLFIKGFANNEMREKFSARIEKAVSTKNTNSLKLLLNRPIILPSLFKEIFNGVKLGDKILLKNKGKEQKIGLFGGFRKEEDQILILPASIRNFLNITSSDKEYDVVVSKSKNEILVL